MDNPPAKDKIQKYRAPALAKGLDILELLSGEPEPVSIAAMTARLGRSRGEIFRMLQELEHRGYIRKTPDGEGGEGFEVTDRMFLLGVQRPKTTKLLEAALPEMRRFAEASGHSVHLALRSQDRIVVLARIESDGPVSFAVRVGYSRHITQATSGIVLFAFQPADIRARWLARFETAPLAFDAAAFLAAAETARTAGVHVRGSTFVQGVTDLSAPVMQRGQAVAALTAPCLKRLDCRNTATLPIDEIKARAAAISRALRGPGAGA